jgi:acetyl esterase
MTPYLDPHMEPILARMRQPGAVDPSTLPHAEGQELFHANAAYWNTPSPPMASVEDLTLAGPAGPLRARLYRPEAAAGDALVVHLHGGGWTFGSVDSHDRASRLLARASGLPLLSVDYRLAPEHPTPAGAEDALAVIDAVAAGAAGRALEPSRIALAGDSAGANIALGALLLRRDAGQPPLAGAALFYGCYAPDVETESCRRFGGGDFGLSVVRMRRYWSNYLGATRPDDPVAAPLHADLAGLPPLYLNAAGLDPLLDDTLNLANRLSHAGVPFTLDVAPGVVHGFMQMSSELPAAARAIRQGAEALRRMLSAE